MARKLYIELGRNGDCINIFPLLWRDRFHNEPANLLVAKEYLPLTQGCSYFQSVLYPGPHNQPARAETWAKQNRHTEKPVVCQVENNPHDGERLTSSYQKESWRLAGALDDFGRWPLVFDRRDSRREQALLAKHRHDKPMILFAGQSISSPFSDSAPLLASLRYQFSEYEVVDMSEVRAERLYDLLGLFDAAVLLVTVDTVHLHLARAARIPVVAIINNGWLGSVPPPSTIATFRYAEVSASAILAACDRILYPNVGRIFHAVDLFGNTERHQRARKTWVNLYNAGVIPVHVTDFDRDARQVQCARPLHYLKDVLGEALAKMAPDDVVIFGPDDVGLKAEVIPWARSHVGLYGAASMRRHTGHCGRELFGFTRRWLDEHWSEIPDFILAVDSWDLGLAALIRHHRGIASTLENLLIDLFPCECVERFAVHETHASSWFKPGYEQEPAAVHNRTSFRKWAEKYQPQIPYNRDSVIA
jgi:hypothetical protein